MHKLGLTAAGVLLILACMNGCTKKTAPVTREANIKKLLASDKLFSGVNRELTQYDRNVQSNCVQFELSQPDATLIAAMTKKYGDFRIPASYAFSDPAHLDSLLYGMDHTRMSILCSTGLYPYVEHPSVVLKSYWKAGCLRDLWIYYGDEQSRAKAVLVLKQLLGNFESLDDRELLSKIDEQGTKNPCNFTLKEASRMYAMLYMITNDEQYALRACLLLERLGQVVGQWPVYSRNEKSNGEVITQVVSLKANQLLDRDIQYGLWGGWGQLLDLGSAKPLLETYYWVKDSRSYQGLARSRQGTITNDLLRGLVVKYLLFPFQPLHNMCPDRIRGLIRFGLVLNEPAFIHQACRWINDALHIGYYRDGFWWEGALSYDCGMTKPLLECVDLLEGYSDPPGYVDAVDRRRFDNFSGTNEFGIAMARIKRPLDLLALPNKRSVVIGDTHWNAEGQYFKPATNNAAPFLLGASCVGMLGHGQGGDQVRLFLLWPGVPGSHRHYDMLGTCLWAGGQEISCETAYIGGMRAWNSSSYAHNTVVIDEQNQTRSNYVELADDASIPLHPRYKWRDRHSSHAINADNNGQLIVWDTTDSDVQAAEVEGVKAYFNGANNEMYRRTLVLVKVDARHFYIVDIFRVRGGRTHDWMLHGNLEKNTYGIKLKGTDGAALPLIAQAGKLGPHLDNLRATSNAWTQNVVAEFSSGDGVTLRTIVAGAPGTRPILARGLAIRRIPPPKDGTHPGNSNDPEVLATKADFLCLRRPGPENVFVAVHEAYRDKPVVKGIEQLAVQGGNPLAVGLKVVLEGREDLILSLTTNRLPAPCALQGGDVKFSGRLLHAVKRAGKPEKVALFDADFLQLGTNAYRYANDYSGKVTGIQSRDLGDAQNAFAVEGALPPGESLKGVILHVYDGGRRAHPYVIAQVERIDAGHSRVITEEETGLRLSATGVDYAFFPCWSVAGPVTYAIPNHVQINTKGD